MSQFAGGVFLLGYFCGFPLAIPPFFAHNPINLYSDTHPANPNSDNAHTHHSVYFLQNYETFSPPVVSLYINQGLRGFQRVMVKIRKKNA